MEEQRELTCVNTGFPEAYVRDTMYMSTLDKYKQFRKCYRAPDLLVNCNIRLCACIRDKDAWLLSDKVGWKTCNKTEIAFGLFKLNWDFQHITFAVKVPLQAYN